MIFFDFPISNLFVAPLFTYSSSSSSLGCLLAITSFIIFFFQVVSFRCPIGFDDSSFFFVHFAFFSTQSGFLGSRSLLLFFFLFDVDTVK